ncbi:MAG: nucleotide exchange factor GrpE [Bacilli bacterium]|jgi:molecular chaperone GrpE|nr:nucleotide exchange factor GrpE [Bacilli bacterium]MDD3121597.1 nucleotide exchange factor GrpE [Bacilli bacterium]MDD4062956.1 nucleotide exchange factor GrpE [Bacilli bacterium]MDD4482314.1 nucleotide exchange factor GrpE [Bacilli bacterium]MDY0363469.1 nucleotide exchange factor GrpE [Bacilli bacterium]
MKNRYREEEKEEMMENQDKIEETENIVLENEKQEDELELLRKEIKRLNNLYLRTLADSENYKKRIDEEKLRDRKYAAQSVLEQLVNIIDIFDKAVNVKTDDQKINNYLIGFKMINNNLQELLKNEGVKKIEVIGKQFDPKLHHAMDTKYDKNKDDGIILEETQTGYLFKDRVLRPSIVIVNKLEENKIKDSKKKKKNESEEI